VNYVLGCRVVSIVGDFMTLRVTSLGSLGLDQESFRYNFKS
jgi:hypothetical protein